MADPPGLSWPDFKAQVESRSHLAGEFEPGQEGNKKQADASTTGASYIPVVSAHLVESEEPALGGGDPLATEPITTSATQPITTSATLTQDTETPPFNEGHQTTRRKYVIISLSVAALVGIGAVAGACGSGACSGGGDSSESALIVTTPEAPTTPAPTSVAVPMPTVAAPPTPTPGNLSQPSPAPTATVSTVAPITPAPVAVPRSPTPAPTFPRPPVPAPTSPTISPTAGFVSTFVPSDTGSSTFFPSDVSSNGPAPLNDACADAIPLNIDQIVEGTTIGATSRGEPACGGASASNAADVWYSVQGSGQQLYATTCTDNTAINGGYDTQLSVFSGSCGQLQCIGGNDDDNSSGTCNLKSGVRFSATPGTSYLIMVHGYSSSRGDFALQVRGDSSPTPSSAPFLIRI